jgi:xylulokinase
MYTAVFDLGTTAVKGVLVSDEKEAVFRYTQPVNAPAVFAGDGADPRIQYMEQDPRDWYAAFRAVSRRIFQSGFEGGEIRGIVMSGQMQDLIPVDRLGEPVRPAILYGDGRAGEEAARLVSLAGEEALRRSTGNALDGSIPAAKLLWFREHEGENYGRTARILGSSKDFVILKLCGSAAADITAASTMGLMDIHTKRWDDTILGVLNIAPGLLPRLCSAGEEAGRVSPCGAEETGFKTGTPVYAGSGDAGASTLASGILNPGEYSIYLGTSGWIAAISRDIVSAPGVFNLAAILPKRYINVVPFLNAGGVYAWAAGLWSAAGGGMAGAGSDDTGGANAAGTEAAAMDAAAALLEKSEAGSGGLLFLPYLAGERFPVMDPRIRGAYIGINRETTPAQMTRACLEGVAFSIRQGLETMAPGEAPRRINLLGGGARTVLWRRILADALQSPVTVAEESSEYLPCIALAAAVFTAQGLEASFESYLASLKTGKILRYDPGPAAAALDAHYRRYLKIYPAVRGIFD